VIGTPARRRFAAALLACTTLLAWPGGGAAAAPLRVVTTTTDLRSLVEVIGGDRVAVQSLLAGAQNPHAFEAKPRDVAALREADLLVRIGLDHDQWVVPLVRRAGNARLLPGAPGHVATFKGIDLLEPTARTGSPAGHVHAFGNTHYWLDPENARVMSRTIAEALAAAAPADRARFERGRSAFLERLDAGLRRWTEGLAPYRGVQVVAFHDSFPYLARRFGLQVVGHIEPQPGIAPPPAHLARVTREMRAHGVKVVLTEAWLPDEVARRVAEAAGATVVPLPTSVGGAPGTDDFLALFDEIVRRLEAGLRAAGPAGR
jgi:ABC-type Zn uptake system ZnuABC Zn-binding protein ZnuA